MIFGSDLNRVEIAMMATEIPATFDDVRRAFGSAVRVGVLLLLVGSTSACYDQILVPDTDTSERATVTNDEEALSERFDYTEEDVPIGQPAAGAFGASMAPPRLAPSSVTLTQIASLQPPLIDGERVQATSISRRTSTAFLVSYNLRGSDFLGGVDYIINWFSRYPRVLSAVSFNDSDVNSVALDGTAIYAAEATDGTGFATSAAIERLGLVFYGLRLEGGARADLSSFAATSVLPVGNTVYVTTGDTGDLYALDATDLSVLAQVPLDDARWVEHDPSTGTIVVLQGTPGRITVFEEGNFSGGTMNQLGSYTFPGADVAESKSTVEVSGGKAFIAAGPAGVQVMCLADGQIIGNVPRPDPAALGLDPDVVVTNAVTVDDDLMFISNGEAGVYVAGADDDWATSGCSSQPIGVIGQLQFGTQESVNHVDYRSGILFVAAGSGGVKVVVVTAVP